MNRQEMLAGLMAQAANAGGDLVTLRAIVEEASELGAERVLMRMGLDDAHAHEDLSRATFRHPSGLPAMPRCSIGATAAAT